MNRDEALAKARQWRDEGMCGPAAVVAIALLAELDKQASAQGVPDERIMHLWDTHVGTPNEKYPFTNGDVLTFARALLSTQASTKEAPAVVDGVGDLIAAAEKYAAAYDGDDRQDIKIDVLNAFYQGADYGQECARKAGAGQAVGKPSMYAVPDKNGNPLFGKGWMFSPVETAQATLPLYTVAPAAVAQEPTDAAKLANGIAAVARHVGIIGEDMPLTGPQLLLLLDDIGNLFTNGRAVPQGWKLVPLLPDVDMVSALMDFMRTAPRNADPAETIVRALAEAIDAAPTPPAAQAADAARIQWISEQLNKFSHNIILGRHFVHSTVGQTHGDTFRQAIDAAMKEKP